MKINRMGCTRIVITTKRFAFKIPNFCEWRLFLHGLLANIQERVFSSTDWVELCPVLFALPCGLLVVMPKAEALSDEEFLNMDIDKFCNHKNYVVPVEHKASSFGLLNGRIVAIDYGN